MQENRYTRREFIDLVLAGGITLATCGVAGYEIWKETTRGPKAPGLDLPEQASPLPAVLAVKITEQKNINKDLKDLGPETLKEYTSNLCELYGEFFNSRFTKEQWFESIQFFSKEDDLRVKLESERGHKIDKISPIEFSNPDLPQSSLYVFLGHPDFSSPHASFSSKIMINQLAVLRSELFSSMLWMEAQEAPVGVDFRQLLALNSIVQGKVEEIDAFATARGFKILDNPSGREKLGHVDWGVRQYLLDYVTRNIGIDHLIPATLNEVEVVNALGDVLRFSKFSQVKTMYLSSDLREFGFLAGNAAAIIDGRSVENVPRDIVARDGFSRMLALDNYAQNGFPQKKREAPKPIPPNVPSQASA